MLVVLNASNALRQEYRVEKAMASLQAMATRRRRAARRRYAYGSSGAEAIVDGGLLLGPALPRGPLVTWAA